MQVSFSGKYIKPLKIEKRTQNGEFIPHKVSLVQFDAKNKADVDAIQKTLDDWSLLEEDCYVKDIRNAARWLHQTKKVDIPQEIYIVTTQKNNFEKLNSKRILGEFMLWNDKNSPELSIDYLQVNPLHNYNFGEFQNYRKIGTSILNEIKKRYHKILTLNSDMYATKFYEKNGFVADKNEPLKYTYTNII